MWRKAPSLGGAGWEMSWVQIPPLPSLVTLARCSMALNLTFTFCKMEVIMIPKGCWGISENHVMPTAQC